MKTMKLDLSKLGMMGHSMGGITALACSREFERDFKYCVALDPWLFPIHKELKAPGFGLKIPFCCISTEKFMSNQKNKMAFN